MKAWPPSFVAQLHAYLLVEALRRLHDRARHGLILVAGEEVDVVVAKAAKRVDLAVLGKLLGALGESLGVRRPRTGLHALVQRLLGVQQHRRRPEGNQPARLALGAGVRPARDDAGPYDVLGMRHLDLPRHIGA